MLCQVKLIRPDGSRARHVGHYPNPGMAMDVLQALHPDCSVNAAVALKATATQGSTPPVGRSCDELGVCQSITRACPPHTICARKTGSFYFAPGAIDAGKNEPRNHGGWVLDTLWYDWAAGLIILAILGAICGWLQ